MKNIISIKKVKDSIFVLLGVIIPILLLSCYSLKRFLFERSNVQAARKRDIRNTIYGKQNIEENYSVLADLGKEERSYHATGLARINSTCIKDTLKYVKSICCCHNF